MKDVIGAIGFMFLLASGAMADSETLVPTVVCGIIACAFLFVAGNLFNER